MFVFNYWKYREEIAADLFLTLKALGVDLTKDFCDKVEKLIEEKLLSEEEGELLFEYDHLRWQLFR